MEKVDSDTKKQGELMMDWRRTSIVFPVALLVLAACGGGMRDTLPVLGQAPAFTLTDSDGAAFSSAVLKGNVWIVDFIFTSCQTFCPVMTSQMTRVHTAYADDERVRCVSISVDPDRDTPDVLREFAARYKADTGRWHFLVGPQTDVGRIAVDGFKVGSKENLLAHSQRLILVDGQGRIRGYYDGMEPASVDQLLKDLAELLDESGP